MTTHYFACTLLYKKADFLLTKGMHFLERLFSPVNAEKISYLSPDWFSFDNHVLVGGGDREV